MTNSTAPETPSGNFGGLECYKTSENQVIAQKLYTREREYNISLQEHYQRGSRRIFCRVTGPRDNILPTCEVFPDLLIDTYHDFSLGERRLELHWTPGGETRSALKIKKRALALLQDQTGGRNFWLRQWINAEIEDIEAGNPP